MQVVIAENDGGRRLAIKHAENPEDAARLRREADLLEVATHPGLVEAFALEDGPLPVLRTGYVDGPSLADERPLDVEEVAGVVAAVASTLADLHGLGLVHGAVAPSHVLIGGDGRPVLCGLGYGGLAGEPLLQAPSLPPEFVDPARADGAPLDPGVDVFGLGALVAFLLDRGEGRGRSPDGDALRSAAKRAISLDISARPTAREVADAAHDAVPGACLPRRGASASAGPRVRPDPLEARRRQRPLEGWRRAQATAAVGPRWRLRTAVVIFLGAVGLGGGLVVAVHLRSAAPPHEDAAPAATSVAATKAVVATPPTTLAATVSAAPVVTTMPPRPTRRAGCGSADGPLTADVDGDGCPETLRFERGVVLAGGMRWAVGQADDEIAVGDWSCSGTRSVAVLRPRTGEVFAFTGWPDVGHDLHAPLVAAVAGGRALRAADLDGDGCNELVVERANGAPVVVRAPRSAP